MITLVCLTVNVFAQNDQFSRKLDSLQKKNNLEEWLYINIENPRPELFSLNNIQKKMWRKPLNEQEKIAWLHLLNAAGYQYLLAGDILTSINTYENAFNYYLNNKLAIYDIVEYTLKPLSNNYTRLGDYERALYLQQRTLNLQLKRKDPGHKIAAVYSNMAISYRSMGNLKQAEACINAGLKMVNPTDKATILLMNILSDIKYDNKDFASGEKLIIQNINRIGVEKEENAYWLMSAYTTAGNLQLALNRSQKADEFYKKALRIIEIFFVRTRIREKANILTQRGTIKLVQKKPVEAIEFFNQSLATLKITDRNHQLSRQKIYGDNKVMEVFEQISYAYEMLDKPNESLRYIRLSLFAADKIRSEFADDKTKERLQVYLKNIAERGIEICFRHFKKTNDKNYLNTILELTEQSKSRTLLDQIYQNQQRSGINQNDSLFVRKDGLERAIIYNEKQALESTNNKNGNHIAELQYQLALINKQIKAKYKQFNYSNFETDVKSLLAKMPETKTIEYFTGEKNIYLIEIEHRRILNVHHIGNADSVKAQIANYISTYFRQGPMAMLNHPKAFYESSNLVYNTVLEKIIRSKNEKLVIIPDGVLGYLSFDGLIVSPKYIPNIREWPFLIYHNIISYAFSIKTLSVNENSHHNRDFTGLFMTHQGEDQKAIKAVADESETLKKLVKGNILIDKQITGEKFDHAFSSSEILHIGTHAYLTGPQQVPTLDFGNEKLFLLELGARKNTPSLVVLSACRTADGLLANGEGIISFSRGFNAIGTPATIASLWNVNDNAASVIMSNFYQQLIKSQTSVTALHQAKLNWLKMPHQNDGFFLPYYWDSLVYMGKDQKFNLKENNAIEMWSLIAAGFIGAITLFFFSRKWMIGRKRFA